MQGTVLNWFAQWEMSYGYIFGEDRNTYKAIDREIFNDFIGRRFLEPNEPVEFSASLDKEGRLSAVDVVRPWAESMEGKPDSFLLTYREACEVIFNDGPEPNHRRFVQRVIGGHLYFEAKHHSYLVPGQIVEVTLRPNPNPKGVWKAIHIRRAADSFEEFAAMSAGDRRARPSYESMRHRGEGEEIENIRVDA